MNKAVLISIQPKWCALILNEKKTIEIRKTRPKLETPFKCYIYCTKQGRPLVYGQSNPCAPECYQQTYGYSKVDADKIFGNLQGKIIGEFVCDRIDEFHEWQLSPQGHFQEAEQKDLDNFLKASCLTWEECNQYRKNLPYYKPLYVWHISDLKIYDTPKELGEFNGFKKCNQCKVSGYDSAACMYDEDCMIPVPIKRAPQSWQYVYTE